MSTTNESDHGYQPSADTVRANAERFSGFADLYDMARPTPPRLVADLLLSYLEVDPTSRPAGPVVVDVGCGTGLSTLIWHDRAALATGVDPSADMLALAAEKARKLGTDRVRFVSGDSTHLPFDNVSTDIITCSQSFHWMEPRASLSEFHRVLVPGGVFAALDCDWPPSIGREAEQLYESLLAAAERIALERPWLSASRKWPKEKHLRNMRASGLFRFSKEVVFHNIEQCDAGRFIAIAVSQGQVQSLLKVGVTENELALSAFREGIRGCLGATVRTLYVSYRMQLAVK